MVFKRHVTIPVFLALLAASAFRGGSALGIEDAISREKKADPPPFSHKGGFISAPLPLVLGSGGGNAVIRYTLDGSEPDSGAIRYTGPIEIRRSCSIRAKAFVQGRTPSPSRAVSFLRGERPPLPLLCIVTDPRNLHDPGIGLLTHPGRRGKEWERPCSVALYDEGGELLFSLDGGLRVAGGVSRHAGWRKKSFRVYFRKEYGTSALEFPVFGREGLGEFGCIRVRASGNDQRQGSPRWTLLRDALNNELWKEAGGCTTDVRFALVSINADLLGIFDLREHCNRTHMRTKYGIEDPDLLKVSVYLGGPEHIAVKDGDKEGWTALEDFVRGSDFEGLENVANVAERIDLLNLIDEHVFRFYGSDWDWPQNNRYMFRDRIDPSSRWRFVMWDSEWSFALGDNCNAQSPIMSNYMKSAHGLRGRHTFMFKKFFKNRSFRLRFANRLLEMLNSTLRRENVIDKIDALAKRIEPCIPIETRRWGGTPEEWKWNVRRLKDFARERPGHFLRDAVGIIPEAEGVWEMMLLTPRPGEGKVRINSRDIPHADGVWDGVFFKGIPVQVEAVPAPGFAFKKWLPEDHPKTRLLLLDPSSRERILLAPESSWRYFDGPGGPDDGWTGEDFRSSSWKTGKGPFGYGDVGIRTGLSPGMNPGEKTPAYYFRTVFDPGTVDEAAILKLCLVVDDGAVVYINGAEVLRVNMPEGNIGPETFATVIVGGDQETAWREFPLPGNVLKQGRNTAAVEVHQVSGASSDIRFDLALRVDSPAEILCPVFERE